ncbi:hypothetical protein PTKIN_Ptkin10aG0107000 [Pterospermum kingtungense]
MAYHQFPSFILPTLLVTLISLSGHAFLAEARNLQETTLPKPELPPLPEIPTLPINLPEPELPPLPEIPGLPKPTLPTIPSLPKDLPVPFFSPPHSTSSP